jgi:hypothetical protein
MGLLLSLICRVQCRQLLCFSSTTGLPVNETRCSKIEPPGIAEVACSPSQLSASCKGSPPPPLEQLNVTVACPEGSALDINGHCCSGGWTLQCSSQCFAWGSRLVCLAAARSACCRELGPAATGAGSRGADCAVFCLAGPFIDRGGICCNGTRLDACGVCGGPARVIDALNTCCNGTLDAEGLCCTVQASCCCRLLDPAARRPAASTQGAGGPGKC